jgi:hypothetical protein
MKPLHRKKVAEHIDPNIMALPTRSSKNPPRTNMLIDKPKTYVKGSVNSTVRWAPTNARSKRM